MKKVLFALAAIFMMAFTVASFTSCGDDDDSTKLVCWGSWRCYGAESDEAQTILNKLEARSNQILGSSFKVPYTSNSTSKYIIQESDLQSIVKTLDADSQIASYIKQLQEMGAYEVDFVIGTGQNTEITSYAWT